MSVKTLLSSLGFMYVWLAQGVGTIAGFINVFNIRVRDVFIQDWHARLEHSTRASLYISNTIYI